MERIIPCCIEILSGERAASCRPATTERQSSHFPERTVLGRTRLRTTRTGVKYIVVMTLGGAGGTLTGTHLVTLGYRVTEYGLITA